MMLYIFLDGTLFVQQDIEKNHIEIFSRIMPARFSGKGLTAGSLVVFVGVVASYPVWHATKGPKVWQSMHIDQE